MTWRLTHDAYLPPHGRSSDVENPLFTRQGTNMLLGDAKVRMMMIIVIIISWVA